MGTVGVCGSINMDVFGYLARPPLPGETVFGKRLAYAAGGKGANQLDRSLDRCGCLTVNNKTKCIRAEEKRIRAPIGCPETAPCSST